MSPFQTGVHRGLRFGNGALEKLQILHETTQVGSYDGRIVALFNPQQLKYERTATWKTQAANATLGGVTALEFQAAEPVSLSIDLFFDSSERNPHLPASAWDDAMDPLASLTAPGLAPQFGALQVVEDVRNRTGEVLALVQVAQELHRPPRCRLQWGARGLLEGVLTRVADEYTHFLADGTAVRANLSCTFKAVPVSVELHSSNVPKTRVVRRGDSLASIAREHYGDAGMWRLIAEANGIDNPRKLIPGTVLAIPTVKS